MTNEPSGGTAHDKRQSNQGKDRTQEIQPREQTWSDGELRGSPVSTRCGTPTETPIWVMWSINLNNPSKNKTKHSRATVSEAYDDMGKG